MSVTAYFTSVIIFDLLILFEFIYSKIRKDNFYLGKDSWASIAMYWGNITVYLFYIPMVYIIYNWVYQFSFFKLQNTWYTWLLLFILEDFCFYWFHRANHRVRLLWASHVNHHSSEYFNLTTAVRQTFTPFFAFIFWLPLLLLGFEPGMVVLMQAISLLYQSLLHTRYIGKLGIFEYVFNTPSHHRVHHGRNPDYIDKNYAGVLIIWDRLFKTFAEEKEEVNYGITERLKSFNPFVIAFHEYRHILKDMLGGKGLLKKIGYVFGPPAHRVSEAPWHHDARSEKITNHIGLVLTHSLVFFLLVIFSPVWLQQKGAIAFVLLYLALTLLVYLVNHGFNLYRKITGLALTLLIAAPALAFPFFYDHFFDWQAALSAISAVYAFIFLLKAISFWHDGRKTTEFLHAFYFLLFAPNLVFAQAFRIPGAGQKWHYLKALAKLCLAVVQLALGLALLYFIAGGFSLVYPRAYVPLAWFTLDYWHMEFYLVLLLKSLCLYLLLSGGLKAFIALFNLVGFQFSPGFYFPLVAFSTTSFWRRFNAPWQRWYRKYFFGSTGLWPMRVIACFALTWAYLVYFLGALAVEDIEQTALAMLGFVSIQAFLVAFELSLRKLLKRRFKYARVLLLPLFYAGLIASTIFFFKGWDQLFL